jgi:hypothetical protein
MSTIPDQPNRHLDPKVLAHRNTLLGFWAAEHMGMMSETAVDYALSLIMEEGQDDTALVQKVCSDMSARGYPIAEDDVRRQLMKFERDARADCA